MRFIVKLLNYQKYGEEINVKKTIFNELFLFSRGIAKKLYKLLGKDFAAVYIMCKFHNINVEKNEDKISPHFQLLIQLCFLVF